MRGRSSRSGLTVIEVLVVAGIISVQAAILVPASTESSERAGQATCAGMLHQIASAAMAYASDNDNTWVIAYTTDENLGLFDKYWMDLTEPYLRGNRIRLCPSCPDPKSKWLNGRPITYGYNGLGLGLYGDVARVYGYDGPADSGDIAKPASTIAFGDSIQWPILYAPTTRANTKVLLERWCNIAVRHLEGTNFACVDGHIRWMSVAQIAAHAAPSCQSQYWHYAAPIPIFGDPPGGDNWWDRQ